MCIYVDCDQEARGQKTVNATKPIKKKVTATKKPVVRRPLKNCDCDQKPVVKKPIKKTATATKKPVVKKPVIKKPATATKKPVVKKLIKRLRLRPRSPGG
jgi:hypothetical protein